MIKTMKINEETHTKLSSLGKKGDTFDNIINKLIDFYKKKNGN